MQGNGLFLLLVSVLISLTAADYYLKPEIKDQVLPAKNVPAKSTFHDTIPTSPSLYDNLFISEYVEGSGNNKYLEIANFTDQNITCHLRLEIYQNGSTVESGYISFSGFTLNKNSVYIIANDSATIYTGYINKRTSGTIMKFDGNDCIVMKRDWVIIDVIGRIGENPGTEWGSGDTSTADNTLRRKNTILHGDANFSDPFYPSSEWYGYPMNDVSDLGNFSPLPVELTSFYAVVEKSGVHLKWSTANEVNNYGFEVHRIKNNIYAQNWDLLGFIQGSGNSNSPKNYSFIDENANAGSYYYRLKQVDVDGNYEYSQTIKVTVDPPAEFKLLQNYPNPFNNATVIEYAVPYNVWIKLDIYNSAGEKIGDISPGEMEAGRHNFIVNMEDFKNPVGSGIYFYKLSAVSKDGNRSMQLVKKMVYIK